MSDYADGAEAMRKAILARFAVLEDEWRVLRDNYDPRGQWEDRKIASQEIEGYKTATGIVRGIILEDRRSMVCLTPKQAHGLADWMRRHGAAELDELAPALTVLILHRLADEADGKGASSVGDSSVARTTALIEPPCEGRTGTEEEHHKRGVCRGLEMALGCVDKLIQTEFGQRDQAIANSQWNDARIADDRRLALLAAFDEIRAVMNGSNDGKPQ